MDEGTSEEGAEVPRKGGLRAGPKSTLPIPPRDEGSFPPGGPSRCFGSRGTPFGSPRFRISGFGIRGFCTLWLDCGVLMARGARMPRVPLGQEECWNPGLVTPSFHAPRNSGLKARTTGPYIMIWAEPRNPFRCLLVTDSDALRVSH